MDDEPEPDPKRTDRGAFIPIVGFVLAAWTVVGGVAWWLIR